MSDERNNNGAASFRELLAKRWLWSYVGAAASSSSSYSTLPIPLGTLSASMSFASFYVLVGIGQMLIITLGPGNIDLSIPYAIGLSGFVAMKTMNASDGSILIGLAAGLATGILIGAFNFALIRGLKVPPMISTMGSGFLIQTLSIVFFRGLQIKTAGRLGDLRQPEGGGDSLALPDRALPVRDHALRVDPDRLRARHPRHRAEREGGLSRGSARRPLQIDDYVICGLFAGITGVLLSAFGGGVTLGMGHEYMLNSVAVPGHRRHFDRRRQREHTGYRRRFDAPPPPFVPGSICWVSLSDSDTS